MDKQLPIGRSNNNSNNCQGQQPCGVCVQEVEVKGDLFAAMWTEIREWLMVSGTEGPWRAPHRVPRKEAFQELESFGVLSTIPCSSALHCRCADGLKREHIAHKCVIGAVVNRCNYSTPTQSSKQWWWLFSLDRGIDPSWAAIWMPFIPSFSFFNRAMMSSSFLRTSTCFWYATNTVRPLYRSHAHCYGQA